MDTLLPKPATSKNDIEKVKHTFTDEIFSVNILSTIVVVLLNGKVFQKASQNAKTEKESSKYKEVFDLKELVKHTEIINEILYVVTVSTIYKVEHNQKENILHINELYKNDFEKITAISITKDEKMIVFGDYEGKITVKNNDHTYNYTEHDDAIVDIVILTKVIFTASEDGILLKTKIGETEPKDAYDVRKPIRYFGKLENKLVILDAYGTPYTVSKTQNDLKKEKRLVKRVTEVQKIPNGIYLSHNNEYYKMTGNKTVQKIPIPTARTEGLFEYTNRLYCYSGKEIKGWPVKKKTELDEFFEDL